MCFQLKEEKGMRHLIGLRAGEASCQRSTAGGQRCCEGGPAVRQQGLQVAEQQFRKSNRKIKQKNHQPPLDLTGPQQRPVSVKTLNILKAAAASNALRILSVEVVPDPEGPGALVFGVPSGRAFQRCRALQERDSRQVVHTHNNEEESRGSFSLTGYSQNRPDQSPRPL